MPFPYTLLLAPFASSVCRRGPMAGSKKPVAIDGPEIRLEARKNAALQRRITLH